MVFCVCFPSSVDIRPVVEDGFYYDIYLPEGKITPADFSKIEKQMQRLSKQSLEFKRYESPCHDSKNEHFERYQKIDGGSNKFKQEIISQLKEKKEDLSFYQHGDFIDLCRGSHVPHSGWLKHVKLTKVSGAYFEQTLKKSL